jgi:hypothetical protein
VLKPEQSNLETVIQLFGVEAVSIDKNGVVKSTYLATTPLQLFPAHADLPQYSTFGRSFTRSFEA